ncbi:MAG TPA: hypothetical protein PKL88_02060 [bacterium]|nr:hypothetical protein [bacterium]
MKIIPLQCEYINKNFYFVGNCKKVDVVKWLNKKYKPEQFIGSDSMGATWFWENKKGYPNVVVWAEHNKDFIYTLYHEIAHAIFFLMKRDGINPRDSHGEHFCYLQEYLVKQVVDKLKHKKTTRKLAKKK